MMSGPFLSSWPRAAAAAACTLKTCWPCPPSQEGAPDEFLFQAFRLNTAWNCQRISNEWSCGALARDPHQYPSHAGGRVLRGNSQLNIVSSFLGAGRLVSRVDIPFSAFPAQPVSSPSVLFLASLRSGPSAVCRRLLTRTPAAEKQLWSGTTSLVQLKEKERPAWPSPPLFTPPSGSTPGHLYNGKTFFFYDKDVEKLPPPPPASAPPPPL